MIVNEYHVRYSKEQRPTMHIGHFHECFELVLVKEGTRAFFVDDKTFTLHKHSAVLIPPKVIHRALASSMDFESYLVMIPLEMLHRQQVDYPDNLFDAFYNAGTTLELTEDQFETLYDVTRRLYDEFKQPKPDDLLQTAMVTQLLIYLNRFHKNNNAPTTQTTKNPITKTVIEYLFNHFKEDIHLDTLSKLCFVSVFHMSKAFKKDTGFTIMEYLNYVRIREAILLMENNNLTITDISYMVGYNSSNHFIRNFKQKIGLTPKQYRLKLKENQDSVKA